MQREENTPVTYSKQVCVCLSLSSPFVDELQLHGLLLLDGGQKFLQVLAVLCDVAVLHLLLLAAVAADQLRPLLSVLCCDVLYLHTHTHTHHRCTSVNYQQLRRLQPLEESYLGFVISY